MNFARATPVQVDVVGTEGSDFELESVFQNDNYSKMRADRIGAPEEFLHFRSEEHTSELQSQSNLVCRLLLEKKQRRQLRELRLHQRPEDAPRPPLRRAPAPAHRLHQPPHQPQILPAPPPLRARNRRPPTVTL